MFMITTMRKISSQEAIECHNCPRDTTQRHVCHKHSYSTVMTCPALETSNHCRIAFSASPESTGLGDLIEWRQKSRQKSRIYWVIIVSTFCVGL